MKVGVHEQYQGAKATTFARTASSFPRTVVTREFESGIIAPQDLVRRMVARCGPIWAAGMTAVWSFKPDPGAVYSGLWKPYVVALAQYIKDHDLHDQVVIVIWHEPENDVPKFFSGPADFVRLFNTIQSWLLSVDPAIVTSHAALAWAYRNWTVAQARAWVTQCTIHSLDIYSGRSFPLAMTLGTSKAFATWKTSRPVDTPWGLSERGWIADESRSAERAASIEAESDYLVALPLAERPSFYVVWNTSGVEDDPTIILDGAAVAAINALFDRMATLQCPLCGGDGTIPADKRFTLTEP
jgi:hypothetical protein